MKAFNHIARILTACILIIFMQVPLAAQHVEREIYATVMQVSKDKDSNTIVVGYTAFARNLKIGQSAKVITRYDTKADEDFDELLANATVTYLQDTFVAVAINADVATRKRAIKAGDLLEFEVVDSLFDPRHLTGHVLALQLQLRNADRDMYFTEGWLREFYRKNPEAADAWLLDTLANDLRVFYEDQKDIFEGEVFTKPFEKGRYKGSNVQSKFANVNREELKSFLWFMISFPGKYIGVPYKFNETYATWLINNSLTGGQEVIRWYHEVNGDSAAFARKLKSVNGVLLEEGLSHNTALVANNNGYWKDIDLMEENKAVAWYSALSGDFTGIGLAQLFTAENLHNSGRYREALPYCYASEASFRKTADYERLLDALFKTSYCAYHVAAYDSSFTALEKARQVLEQQAGSLSESTVATSKRKYYEYYAYTNYYAGRYTEADTYLDTAITKTRLLDRNQVASSLAYDYWMKSKVLKNQQRYDLALEAADSSAMFYREAGDTKSAGISVNDKAVILFKQGKYEKSNELLRKTIALFEMLNDFDNAGFAYSQMGQNFWDLYKYDTAIECHNKAIAYRRKAGNITGEAFSWEQLGTLYQRAGFKQKALTALDSAALLYTQSEDRKSLADVSLESGKVYEKDKENDKAELYYRKAADALGSLGNTAGYADALFSLGLLVFEKKADLSLVYMDSCRTMSNAAGLRSQEAYAMMNLGALNKNRGHLQEGKDWYAKAKKIVDDLNEPHATAQYWRNMGSDAEWELNLDSANRCYDRARMIFDSTDQALAIQMLSRQAANLQNMGEYTRAEKLIDTVIERARTGNYLLELGGAYQNKAWSLLQQGQTDAGKALADSAAKYYQLSGNNNSLASIYSLRGDYNRKLFDFKEAYNWYSKADSLWRADGNNWARSSGMINFIVLYYYQGDYQTSLDYTYKALAARPFLLEDQTYVDLQACLAENYYYLNKIDSANYFLDNYIPLARSKKLSRSDNWLSLMKGRILVDDKKYNEAIPFLRVATSAESAKNDLVIYQQALPYLGMAYSALGKKDSANAYFNSAVKTANTFELPSFSWEALYLAGLDAYNHDDFERAIPLFKQSVALVNKQASNLYGGEEAGKLFKQQPTKADLYFKLMSALTKVGKKDEAWQYANLSQAAAVSDLAGGLSAELSNPEKAKALQEAQAKFQQIQTVGNALQESKKDSASKAGQIAVLEKTKAIAEEEYLNYIEQLKKDFPELGTFFANQVNPENFRNLHGYLPEDMAMLMYVINDKELMIFWATTNNTGIVTGKIPDNFYEQAEAWLTALKNPERPAGAGPLVLRTQIGKVPKKAKPTITVKDGAEQLYNLLIAPVYKEIKDKESWCIIPNGRLTHLPFHVFGTNNTEGKFEYLAASKNIFYTNKPNELFLPWNRRNKQSFAALGNPDKSLASAGEEVKQIGIVFPAATVYTEGEATVEKASASLSSMQYVHFATHGVLSYPDFDSSYLVFAPGADQPNGGKLTLYDIRRLNIKGCDLVTLSACETAVSAEIGKGWYVSPANAFLINKVRSVVASLWEVDDKSTSMLMQRFYHHLQTMPKALALRQAMADVSAVPEFEHPFYWSAFVLYGDWQ